jgi:Anti-sigma factor NepR
MNTGKPVNLEKPTPVPEADEREDQAVDTPVTQTKREVRLGREVQARIGQQLRAMYDEVVKEGVPQHIGDLVRRLSEQDDGAA